VKKAGVTPAEVVTVASEQANAKLKIPLVSTSLSLVPNII